MTSFHVMAKPVGSACNLSCSYCFYKGKGDSQKFEVMNDEVLRIFTEKYIAENSDAINFAWQGGEPLLAGIDFYKKAISLQKNFAHKKITNAMQTNATLITDEWCEFFKSENFLLGISIDGSKEIHNANRNESYAQAIRGLELCKKHKVEFNLLCTVNSKNMNNPKGLYNFLKDTGAKHIQFIPIIESLENGSIARPLDLERNAHFENLADFSTLANSYGDFLIEIFKDWIKKDFGKIFIQNFDALINKKLFGINCVCAHAQYCGQFLALEKNGDVYSCDHYVFKENLLGNVLEKSFEKMIFSNSQKNFGEQKFSKLSKKCLACKFLEYCHGDCPKNRTVHQKDDYPLSALCKSFEKFYSYALSQLEPIIKKLKANR